MNKKVQVGLAAAIAAVVGYAFITSTPTPAVDTTPDTNSDADAITAAEAVVQNDTYRGSSLVIDNDHGDPTVKRYDAAHVARVCFMVDEPTFHDHNWHYDDDGVKQWCVAYMNPAWLSTPGQTGIMTVSRQGVDLGAGHLKIQTYYMQKGYVQ